MNQIKILNLEVVLSNFWQLARQWKSGEKAKIDLAYEGGNLHLHLSAMLGHPDHVNFPTPSSPPPHFSAFLQKKIPIQVTLERAQAGRSSFKTEKDGSLKEAKSKPSEEEVVDLASEDNNKISAEKPTRN